MYKKCSRIDDYLYMQLIDTMRAFSIQIIHIYIHIYIYIYNYAKGS